MKIRTAFVAVGVVAALTAGTALAQADNTNSRWSPSVFDTWMDRDYSITYSDRVAREAYREQMERRREAMERHERLSRAQIDDQVYGVSPDPSRVGPSNSSTNPAGNEARGENSGGK